MAGPAYGRAVLLAAVLSLGSCAHDSSGEIDVDLVQGQANQVEQELRVMRQALRDRDLDRATRAYRQAEETLVEYRDSLSAYPELGELKQSMRESGERLCYAAVDIGLERFFQAVRAQQLSEARERLSEAQTEHTRCRPQIQAREDYVPLKLNLDSAPEALAGLEREADRPGLRARVQATLDSLRGRLAEADKRLEQLEARPLERQLAAELDGELQGVAQALEQPGELADEPEWVEAATGLKAEHQARTARLQALVRRGKLRWIAERDWPEAGRLNRAAGAAAKSKALPQMKLHIQAALELYRGCQRTAAEVAKEEPALAKTTWPVDGQRRSPAWLQDRCRREADRLEGWLKKIDRTAPPPPKPAPAVKPKPKPKKTGRRIQRW